MDLRDLPPRKDPKGGSPRTPSSGIPLRTVQQYSNGNGNGTIWKMATSILAGVNIGLVAAYFTALQSKGVSQKDMQEYVDKFSPYSQDKKELSLQQQNQDKELGTLSGQTERIFTRLNTFEEWKIQVTRDIQDQDSKIKLLTNYIEAEKSPRK